MEQVVGSFLVSIPLANEVREDRDGEDAGGDEVEGRIGCRVRQLLNGIHPVGDQHRVHH